MRRDLKTPLSRADLAWLLAEKGGEGQERAVATLMGYDPVVIEEEEIDEIGPEAPLEAGQGREQTDVDLRIEVSKQPKAALAFWRVVSAEYFDDANAEAPEWRKKAKPLTSARLKAARREADPGRPFPFLTPWPRLWPFLRKLLSREVEGGPVDVDKLVREVADLKPIKNLPRKKTHRWARSIHVLKDRSEPMAPFYKDMDALTQNLDRICGRHRLKIIVLPTGLDGQGNEQNQEGEPTRYKGGEPRTTVLALTDFGANTQSGRLSVAAREIAERAAKTGGRVCALVPSPRDRWPEDLTEHWQAVRWDLGQRPRPAKQRVETTRSISEPTSDELFLALCGPLVRLEPELIRYARTLLPYAETHAGMESDIFMKQVQLHSKRELFKTHSQSVREAFIRLVDWYHADVPEIRAEEMSIIRGVDEEMERFIEEHTAADEINADLVAAADERRYSTLDYKGETFSGYMQRRTERMPDGAYRDSREAALWALSHLNEDDQVVADVTPREISWSELAWVLKGGRLRAYRLSQFRHALTIGDAGHRLGAISTTQNVLSITPEGETPAERQQWRLNESGPRILAPDYSGAGYEIESTASRLRLGQISKPYWALEMGQENVGLFMRLDGPNRWHWVPPSRNRVTERGISEGVWVSGTPWDKEYDEMSEKLYLPGLYIAQDDQYGLYQDVDIQGVVQRFRWIPPGEFLMGSPEDEPGRRDIERQHEVVLTRGFWLADTACTQALWQAVMGENPSRFPGADRPVETVSWEDCNRFVERVNAKQSELFLRLPTEAEWEYACRAGTLTPFSFGENITTEQVNFDGKYPYHSGKRGDYREQTVPVRKLPPNRWGLYEMHGNVMEWCLDWEGKYMVEREVDPKGAERGDFRVLRGGAWIDSAKGGRSARRSGFPPDRCRNSIGFRLARGPVEPGQGAKPRDAVQTEVEWSGTGGAPRKGRRLSRFWERVKK